MCEPFFYPKPERFIAWVSTIRRESTREENAELILAIKTKARNVVGRGETSLRSDPGSELRLGRAKEKEKCEDIKWDEQKNKKKKTRKGSQKTKLAVLEMARRDISVVLRSYCV